MNTLAKLLEAASFAAKRHTGQHRKGRSQEPYINHPLEVASLLANIGGVTDIDVLIAAILHDTLEDTATKPEELAERFGERVRDLVLEVTDDKSLPKQRRKDLQVEHAPHLSPGAKTIKLGDKISNIVDITERPPSDWSDERRRQYIDWGERVVAGLRGSNAGLEAKFDEAARAARKAIG
ncbi:MAG: HD domain-containing protein [Pyrinomonadaceae bacterium]